MVLGGQYCTLSLYQRGPRMYLDLYSGDAHICSGAICQDGTDVVRSPSPEFRGSLHFMDTKGSSAPQYDGLGSRYALFYAEEGEDLPDRLLF